jgi:hypothetical protein
MKMIEIAVLALIAICAIQEWEIRYLRGRLRGIAEELFTDLDAVDDFMEGR